MLAITALLLGTILAGSATIQNRTAFTSAVDAMRYQLKEVQNEAIQSVSDRNDSNVGTSNEINFGKLVEFNDSTTGSPAPNTQMKTWTLVENSAHTALIKCDEKDITLAQGLNFIRANGYGPSADTQAVIFGRDPNQTYAAPSFTENPILPDANAMACDNAAPVAPAQPSSNNPNCAPANQNNPIGTCTPPVTPPAPPPTCENYPSYQCGLYGQYYTGAVGGSLDSAFIDQGIGESMGNGASSSPSFTTTLAQRTQSPPTGVSVNWSGQILIGASDYPNLNSHTYCFTSDASAAQLTIDGIAATATANGLCATIAPANLASGAGWYPININYTTSSGAPVAKLSELDSQTENVAVEVPGGPNGDLATLASNKPIAPGSSFVNGLYGQYYSDLSYSNRVSAYTDPVIGDGGTQFSFNAADLDPNTGAILTTANDAFSPVLRWNTASTDSSGKSVKWTGQILVDTAGSQQYCEVSDDQASVSIDGTTVINDNTGGHSDLRLCGTANLTAGWHNLQVLYQNICCTSSTPSGAWANVRLEHVQNGQYVEVPHDHLRRPLDWSAVGSSGSCNSGQPGCTNFNNSTGEDNSSTASNNSCSNSNHVGQITYSKSGLTPDSTYNMDISYFNEPNVNGLTVPSNYSYLVCVAIQGTMINGGNPISMPISEPSLNPRTYTLSGISVPASGQAIVTLDWLNDSYCDVPLICGYDANFGVSRLDLYRNLLPNGQLSSAPPKVSSSSSMVASASSPSPTQSGRTLASRLLNAVLPTALAASPYCTSPDPTNVLDPANYTADCFAATVQPHTYLYVDFPSSSNPLQGSVIVNTEDNSIDRIIN